MDYIHTVVRGTISGASTFSMSVDMNNPAATNPMWTQINLDTFAEQAWTDFKAQVLSGTNDLRPAVGNIVTFTGVDAYATPRPGLGSAYLKGSSSSAAVPGSGGSVHPVQIALVVSKLTANPSAHGRGRMYFPALALSLFGTPQTSAAQATTAATAFANWLSLLNTRSVGGTALVASVVGGINRGNAFPITRVRVDTVPDTVRARRNKVIATNRPTITVVVP